MFKVIGLAWPGRDTDEDDFYMKIVTFDKIYNFSSFEFLSFAISLHAQKII